MKSATVTSWSVSSASRSGSDAGLPIWNVPPFMSTIPSSCAPAVQADKAVIAVQADKAVIAAIITNCLILHSLSFIP